MEQAKINSTQVSGYNVITRTRQLSESSASSGYVIEENSDCNCNYDAEAIKSHTNHNIFGKVRNSVTRFLKKFDSDSTAYNYGDYPLGNEYNRDWDTW